MQTLGMDDTSEFEAASTRVAIALRKRIIAGDLAPGTALREVAIADEMSVSRNTLREALRQLAADGLIKLQLHKGATVRILSLGEIQDIYRVRRGLELRAVEDSSMASQVSFNLMQARVSEVSKAASEERWKDTATHSLQFHQAIVGLLESRLLSTFFDIVIAQLRLAFARATSERQFQLQWVARDVELCELISSGNRQAAGHALSIYLQDSEKIVLDITRRQEANKSLVGTEWTSARRRST